MKEPKYYTRRVGPLVLPFGLWSYRLVSAYLQEEQAPPIQKLSAQKQLPFTEEPFYCCLFLYPEAAKVGKGVVVFSVIESPYHA